MNKRTLLGLASLYMLAACGGKRTVAEPPPPAPPPPPPPAPVEDPAVISQLEAQLEAALRQRAPSGSVDGFRLPDAGVSAELATIPQFKNPLTPAKVALGKVLFHDPALLVRNRLAPGFRSASCASCHTGALAFKPGLRQGLGEGGVGHGTNRVNNYPESETDAQPIATPATINLAWQRLMLWNGELGGVAENVGFTHGSSFNALGFEGIETQAMQGQENHRLHPDGIRLSDPNGNFFKEYLALFRAAYGETKTPNELFTVQNTALAIGAYVRTITSAKAPFQNFVRGSRGVLKTSELRGALLFFGKAGCFRCHAGPALNSNAFHAMGYGDMISQPGSPVLKSNPASLVHRGRGGFTGNPNEWFKFKVPQLYNLKDSRAFGHGGTFTRLRDVVNYYNNGNPQKFEVIGSGNLSPLFRPLGLGATEVDDLTNFLENGLHDPDMGRHVPTRVPSGTCFPSNDPLACP